MPYNTFKGSKTYKSKGEKASPKKGSKKTSKGAGQFKDSTPKDKTVY